MANPISPAFGGAPPMGSSPMAVPTGNAGSMANAKAQLADIYTKMVKLLAEFPAGTDDHKSMLSVLTTLNKIAPQSAAIPGVQATAGAGMSADANKNAAQQMLKSLAPAGPSAGGGGAGPTAGPPSPAMPPSLA